MKLAPIKILTAATLLASCALLSVSQAQHGNVSCQSCMNLASPHPIWAVDSLAGCGQGEAGWKQRSFAVNWQSYAQGEYVGTARTAHVPEYRIRVDDQIAFVFRLTREESSRPYELQVGDTIRVESLTGDNQSSGSGGEDSVSENDNIRRELVVQPDGSISLPLLGQVRAARMTIDGLRQQLEERYEKFYKVPAITVTPVLINTKLQDLLASVDARQGVGGLQLQVIVTPAGKIYVPALGAICAQGLTLEELKSEIDARYAATIPGVAVTPVLTQRAPRFIYVLGEVVQPGQFELTGPTTLLAALAFAEGPNIGGNTRQVVVLRRGEDWRLMATMVDIRGALYGRRPVPADEIWLRDSDIVIVPKTPIQATDEFISQYFSQGLYSLFPQFANGQFNFQNFNNLSQ